MQSANEWVVEFNQLYNNITSNQAPGLTEYEISIFLTRAQEDLVKDYFSPKSNSLGEGFDDSERRQSDFASLIYTHQMSPINVDDDTSVVLDKRTTNKYYQYPSDVFILLNEVFQTQLTSGGVTTTKTYNVVPLSYKEYSRLIKKPYKYPPKGQVWRLMTGEYTVTTPATDNTAASSATYRIVEMIGKFPTNGDAYYTIRYVKRPSPIVLGSANPSIEGQSTASLCSLPEHLHSEILYRAVQLAKVAWIDTVAPSNGSQR